MNSVTSSSCHIVDLRNFASIKHFSAVSVFIHSFAMFSLADFLLSKIPYRLPPHLYSYTKGVTPLSTDSSVIAALVVYLVTIFGIQALQRNRPAYKINALFQVHNVVLSVGSALLFVLMLEEILPILWNHGVYYALCADGAWTPVRWPCDASKSF